VALTGYEDRKRIFGPLPGFQAHVRTVDALRRQLAGLTLSSDPQLEKRYPYLDRGLLEFLSAIPCEQLVRPGQRRSLMRRALIGIVPDELLNRKRKAFVARGPMVGIAAGWPRLLELGQQIFISSIGIADSTRFVEALQRTQQGVEVPIVQLMRTLGIELWLRNLTVRRVLGDTTSKTRPASRKPLLQTRESV